MITLEAYIAEATRLFGPDRMKWKFACPCCHFNIGAVKKLRTLSQKVSDASHEMKAIAQIVTEMQNICKEMEGY